MSAISGAFDRIKRAGGRGIVAYVTAGDPDQAQSIDIVQALDRGGADIIEVGVPFSDPVADGPAIQAASERALAAGGSLERSLELVQIVKPALKAPIVLFTYINPVLRMGTERFISRAAQAGVDGVLLLDLPIEESEAMHQALDARGIDQIFLVSPTTSDVRLKAAATYGSGFLYAISRLGVTGVRDSLSETAAPLVARVRKVTDLPVALGFGISRPEHVAAVCTFADAAVVGSAIVQTIAKAVADGRDAAPDVEALVRRLKPVDARATQ